MCHLLGRILYCIVAFLIILVLMNRPQFKLDQPTSKSVSAASTVFSGMGSMYLSDWCRGWWAWESVDVG